MLKVCKCMYTIYTYFAHSNVLFSENSWRQDWPSSKNPAVLLSHCDWKHIFLTSYQLLKNFLIYSTLITKIIQEENRVHSKCTDLLSKQKMCSKLNPEVQTKLYPIPKWVDLPNPTHSHPHSLFSSENPVPLSSFCSQESFPLVAGRLLIPCNIFRRTVVECRPWYVCVFHTSAGVKL